ncbi:MAG: ice-binding family protein [Candidatus Paceibacterota bacterium]
MIKKLDIKKISKAGLVLLLFGVLMSGATAYAAGPAAVNLGTAGNYVILSKTGISTTGTTMITGDIGVSPAAATYITGFGLTADTSNVFSVSSLVTGKVYAPTYAVPTPANLTTAVSDMETAYADAAGRTNPTATELGAGDISGLTIAPGLYKWGTSVSINTDVTLSGGANDVWIFQIAQGLTVASGKKVVLSGGAQAKNVFWQVGSNANIGTTAQFNGNILAQTAINLQTGASLNGRALAQTAVTLDANTVTTPGNASQATNNPPVVAPSATPTQTQTSNSSGSGIGSAVSTVAQTMGVNASQSNFASLTPAEKKTVIDGIKSQLISLIQQLIAKLQTQLQAQQGL